MGMARDFDDLSQRHARWRILRCNLGNGIDANLHSRNDVMRFASKAGLGPDLKRFTLDSSDPDVVMDNWWKNGVRPFRLAGPGSKARQQQRVEALPAMFPCAHFARSGLAQETLYRVVPNTSLVHLIGAANDFWNVEAVKDLDILNTTPKPDSPDMETWCNRLGSLEPEKRRFCLLPGASLAAGMIWFARERDIGLAWNELPSPARAQAARDLLGLVHLPFRSVTHRTWLFALRFPGAAADAVGHYRPSAMDAVDNARFQVPALATTDGAWGCTAQLAALSDRTVSLDGAPERIANQIRQADLGGSAIEFALLGELTDRHAGVDADFADRLRPQAPGA